MIINRDSRTLADKPFLFSRWENAEMLAYLVMARIEEYKPLSRHQRDFVWRNCVHPLTIMILPMGMRTFLLLLFLNFAFHLESPSTIAQFAIMFAAFFIPGELVDLIVVDRNRQKIIEFLQVRKLEINAVT